MRVLGVDLGHKRIGLAVSDELGITAQGLPTLTCARGGVDFAAFDRLIAEWGVGEVVVGFPKKMDGTVGEEALKAQRFAEELQERCGVRTVLWDERLTSREAERLLVQADLRRARRRQVRDQVAAVLILQGYLDRRRTQEAAVSAVKEIG